MNAYEELLAAIPDEADREALKNLGEKHPKLREGVLNRADYSRRLDEVRDQVAQAEAWKKWREQYWIENAYGDGKGATKRELEKDAKLVELQQQLATGGDVNFDELNTFLDEQIKTRNIVTRSDLDSVLTEKTKDVQGLVDQNVKGYAYVATTMPELLFKFRDEFPGEPLLNGMTTDQFIGEAVKANEQDLRKFYDSFVADKRAKAQQKKHDDELVAVREDERKKVIAEKFTGEHGQMPVDSSGPDMGHFQRRLSQPPAGDGSAVQGNPPLGRGSVARQAAFAGDKKEAESAAA